MFQVVLLMRECAKDTDSTSKGEILQVVDGGNQSASVVRGVKNRHGIAIASFYKIHPLPERGFNVGRSPPSCGGNHLVPKNQLCPGRRME
jgi:hypothetical protein